MRRNIFKSWLVKLVALAGAAVAAPALAQNAPAPEQYRNADEFGVDQVTGTYNFALTEGSIGPSGSGVALVRYWGQSGWRDNWSGDLRKTAEGATQVITITFGGTSQRFTLSGATWVPANGNGATLSETTADREWLYRAADGTTITYQSPLLLSDINGSSDNLYTRIIDMPQAYCNSTNALACGVSTRIERPDGNDYALTWHTPEQCTFPDIGGGIYIPDDPSEVNCTSTYRLTDVRSASGYAMKIKYAINTSGNNGTPPGWFQRTGAKFLDLNQVYCDPAAMACDGVAGTWPTVSYAYPSGALEITNSVSGVWRVTLGGGGVTAIRRPGASVDTTTITRDANSRVTTITDDGATRSYAYTVIAGGVTNTAATDSGAGGGTTNTQRHPTAQAPTAVIDEAGQVTTYIRDASNRVVRETRPEGDYSAYTRDARGNVTEARQVAKPGSGLADVVTTANYDASCTVPARCNSPNYVIDPIGNRTDYSYDATHGQVTRIQLPSSTTGGARAEVNYTYSTLYAQIRDAANNLVNSTDPQYKVTGIASCATAATCAGTANESRVTIAYGANLLPSSVTTAAGDNSVSATTTYAYDAHDNLVATDGPLPGSDDVVTSIYDSADRRRGVIGPDPDGAGPRTRVGERYTFDSASRVTKVERGTVSAATAAALDAMAVSQTLDVLYDANGRATRETASASGTTTNVAQYSYDAQGRSVCTALRMNPAVWASLPADACTPGAVGPEGPDRITRSSYDAADRVISVETALGTAAASTEVATAYSANGLTASVTDGEGNRTTYVYDGHNRLSQTRYPVSAVGAGTSSTTDYEGLSYDGASRVISRRLRDGSSVGLTYDNLGRLTARNLPGAEPDASYAYDLAGRMVSAVQDGRTLGFAYGALGRVTSATGPHGTNAYQYDVAGRRTRMTYADGFYVAYDYDVIGNVTAIRENGAASGVGVLASYAYDALGRRSSVTFGNGTTQTYGFDAASRLTSLANNLGGTAQDQSVTFGYNASGQIATTTRANDAYAWDEHYNIDRLYTVNGLNQILTAGQLGIAHDARGNLTTSGTSTYSYNADNLMVSASNGASLAYDPLGRLAQTVGSGVTTRYAYDGVNLIAEYNASNVLLRRYVHGPGSDEPIVWYEGASTADRRFLMRDERGSIVSVANAAGTTLAINAYDEYGIPSSANIGRFGFTGQTWLPEIGMYHYKARLYSPTLGRFMQSDPIGYADGMNMYGYVGGDPVNYVDPLGLETTRNADGSFCVKTYYYHYSIYQNSEGRNAGPLHKDGETNVCTSPTNFGFGPGSGGGGGGGGDGPDIVVTGRRPDNALCPFAPSAYPQYVYVDIAVLFYAKIARERAVEASRAYFPGLSGVDDERDAFRHVMGAALLARGVGGSRAIGGLNTNEAQGTIRGLLGARGYTDASRNMDQYNNYVGVSLADDPRYAHMTAEQIANFALGNGCARLSP